MGANNFADKSSEELWQLQQSTHAGWRRTIVGVVAIAALVSVALTACSERKEAVFDSAPKLIAAAQEFARDYEAREQPLPPTVKKSNRWNRGDDGVGRCRRSASSAGT